MPTPDIAWAYPLLLQTHVGLVTTSVGLFAARAIGVLGALLCVAFMASIALARHPLGWWAP